MPETLADLYRRVGLHAAWEDQPEAQPGYKPPRPLPRRLRSVQQRLGDPHEGVRRQATEQYAREQSRRNQFYADAMQNELGRNEVNTPPDAYFGQDVLEMTGAPALSRSFDAIAADDPERALTEGAWGALGILGTATLPPSRGALRVPRVPAEPVAPLPVNPARTLATATDGSILPMREPQPFRNSLRGGSDDLAEAALPASRAPDAGQPGARPEANVPDGGSAGAERLGPSLRDMVDDGNGGLIIDALRRNRANISRLEDQGVFERPMPQRSLPLDQLRRTDHTPPEQQWVDHYTQNAGEPIIVRQNKRGGYDVIDGHHRLAAAQARGDASIEVYDASLYFAPERPNAGDGLPPRRTPRGRQ